MIATFNAVNSDVCDGTEQTMMFTKIGFPSTRGGVWTGVSRWMFCVFQGSGMSTLTTGRTPITSCSVALSDVCVCEGARQRV